MIVVIAVLAGLSAACGEGDAADESGSATTVAASPTRAVEGTALRSTTPSATAGVARPLPTIVPGRSTGRPVFDRLAELVQIPDIPSLVAAVKYTEAPCTKRQGIGGPPQCTESEAEGTTVRYMPLLACEGQHVRPDLVAVVLGGQLRSPKLYSVFELKDPNFRYFPLGEFGMVFELPPSGTEGLMIGVDRDGGIISLVRLCGGSPAELMMRYRGAEVLLAPLP